MLIILQKKIHFYDFNSLKIFETDIEQKLLRKNYYFLKKTVDFVHFLLVEYLTPSRLSKQTVKTTEMSKLIST